MSSQIVTSDECQNFQLRQAWTLSGLLSSASHASAHVARPTRCSSFGVCLHACACTAVFFVFLPRLFPRLTRRRCPVAETEWTYCASVELPVFVCELDTCTCRRILNAAFVTCGRCFAKAAAIIRVASSRQGGWTQHHRLPPPGSLTFRKPGERVLTSGQQVQENHGTHAADAQSWLHASEARLPTVD